MWWSQTASRSHWSSAPGSRLWPLGRPSDLIGFENRGPGDSPGILFCGWTVLKGNTTHKTTSSFALLRGVRPVSPLGNYDHFMLKSGSVLSREGWAGTLEFETNMTGRMRAALVGNVRLHTIHHSLDPLDTGSNPAAVNWSQRVNASSFQVDHAGEQRY